MLTRATKYFKPGLTLLALAMLLFALPASATPGANRQPVASPIMADPVSIQLCADENTATMPDGVVVNFWGFSICNDSLPIVTSPGPTLQVNAGDIVTVTLYNNLATENVSLVFPGQAYPILTDGFLAPPDTVGVAPGGSRTYEFTATSGTYLYESGTNVGIQIPMGLYGALVVHPTTCT
ncbi:MAG: multicopper oxidase domain-containing protein, partial [Chloroflexota bacterium]